MSRVFVPVPLFVFFQLLSVFPSALIVLWMSRYRGGFSWSGDDENCNWHPVFMVTGQIYFMAQAISAFRLLPFAKRVKKFIHGCLHVGALICSGVGIFAIFTTHQKEGHEHLYSLHSWCGIIAVGLFVLQYLVGFSTFFFPGAKAHIRLFFRPIHVKIGQFIFGLSVATALMGINQELRIKHEGSEGLTSEGLLGNVTGLMIVLLALLVFYILTRQAYRPESRDKSDLLLP